MARKSPEVFGAQCSRKYKTNFPETEKPSVRAKNWGSGEINETKRGIESQDNESQSKKLRKSRL